MIVKAQSSKRSQPIFAVLNVDVQDADAVALARDQRDTRLRSIAPPFADLRRVSRRAFGKPCNRLPAFTIAPIALWTDGKPSGGQRQRNVEVACFESIQPEQVEEIGLNASLCRSKMSKQIAQMSFILPLKRAIAIAMF